jgi:hypothetical protein
MSLLDDGQLLNNLEGPEFHEEIVNRWGKILKEGLDKDKRKNILEKYPTGKNLQLAKAPKLNDEILSSLPDQAVKQDNFLCQVQNHISAILTAMGSPINQIITQVPPPENDNTILKNLIDAGRLLTDLHYSMSKHRKYLIGPLLNSNLKKVVEESPITDNLFGDNLYDRIKSDQAIKKAGVELIKQKSKVVTSTSQNHLNFKRGSNRGRQKDSEKRKWQYRQKSFKGNPYQSTSKYKRPGRTDHQRR